MGVDDFRSNEKSWVAPADDTLTITFVGQDGSEQVLKQSIPVVSGEVVDGTVLHVAALEQFLQKQIQRAADEDLLFSVHLKATMMKVSDPIIFGHVIRAFFPDVFARYGADLAAAGLTPNDGLGSIYAGLDALPNGAEIKRAFQDGIDAGPDLAMVDSDKGITNLHVPSDVIVDASMPAMIRTSGHMWGPDGDEHDTVAVIPDSSYAGIYQAVIEDCRAHGAFDPATMGSVPNVGLMALKAEEYGSHDKTFELPGDGVVRVTNAAGETVLEHDVEQGDIWRACQTKDIAIRDWVKLAVTRARATGSPAVFWLDETRAHDAVLIGLVRTYLQEHDTDGLQIEILSPEDAMRFSLDRIRRGEDTISVTGNVLRDYLTDLFPIMEPRHLGEDALRRPAPRRWRPVRDRCRRLRTEARPAARAAELPALGQPGRVPGPRGQPRAPGRRHRQRPGEGPGGHARPRDRHLPRRGQVPGPQARLDRQPWQPLLPGEVLGRRARCADPGHRASPRRSRVSRRPSPSTRTPSSRNSSRCRVTRRTSAATTGPTTPRPVRSCVRRRR